MFKIDILGLCDKLSHENEEKDETIHELQSLLKFRTNENKSLYTEVSELKKEIERLTELFDIRNGVCIDLVEEIKELQSKLSNSKNDLQQATNKIKLLNNQIDNLQRNIGYLCEENTRLRHELNEVKKHDGNY